MFYPPPENFLGCFTLPLKILGCFFWNFSDFFGFFRIFSEFFGIFRNFSEFFRNFSVFFPTKLRSCLGDEIVSALILLKSYYRKKNKAYMVKICCYQNPNPKPKTEGGKTGLNRTRGFRIFRVFANPNQHILSRSV